MSFIYAVIVYTVLIFMGVDEKIAIVVCGATIFFHHYCIVSKRPETSYSFDDYFIESLIYYKETFLQKIGLHKPSLQEVTTLKNLNDYHSNILFNYGIYNITGLDNICFSLKKHYKYLYRVKHNQGIYDEYTFLRQTLTIYTNPQNDDYWTYMGLKRKHLIPSDSPNDIRRLVTLGLTKNYITENEADFILNHLYQSF